MNTSDQVAAETVTVNQEAAQVANHDSEATQIAANNADSTEQLPTEDQIGGRDSEIEEKDKDYFDVEKIIRMRRVTIQDGRRKKVTREFLIKWSGYDARHNSWEPEPHLDGCVETLNKFLDSIHEARTKIKQRVGAEGKAKFNEDNWVEVDRILIAVKSVLNHHSYSSGLDVAIYEDRFLDHDSLYLFVHRKHCFVILHRALEGIYMIADGTNSYLKDEAIKMEVDSILGRWLESMKFVSQCGVDHCASSAVVIAREMARLYKNRSFYDKSRWPSTISVPLKTFHRLQSIFHKHPSERLSSREENIKKKVLNRCALCGFAVQSNKKTAIRLHELHCFKKHINEAVQED